MSLKIWFNEIYLKKYYNVQQYHSISIKLNKRTYNDNGRNKYFIERGKNVTHDNSNVNKLLDTHVIIRNQLNL